MPELPEVETVVKALKPDVLGRTITNAHNDTPRQLHPHTLDSLRHEIIGQRINTLHRRAKYIVFTLSNDTLIIHLRMTGHLSVVDSSVPRHKFVHTWFDLDNGRQLRFRDMRKFGTVTLTNSAESILGKLGPEPLSPTFTIEQFQNRLSRRTSKMKPLLLNQTFIAGVGNIYADEALFTAGIDPRRTADTLTQAETEKLYHAIRHVLQLGIDREGASISDYVKPDGNKGDMQNVVNVFRRTSSPCYTCGTPIQRIKLAQRSTHFCPTCQSSAVNDN